MSKVTSLNMLMGYYEQFADAHLQLNDFYDGQNSEASTTRQLAFPYLWVSYDPSNLVVSNRNQVPEVVLSFFVADQWNNQKNFEDAVGDNSNNIREVLSDTFQICQDLLTYTTNNLRGFGVSLVDNSYSIEPAYNSTPDKAYGWQLTLTLRLVHSSCELPGNFENVPTPIV